MATEAVALTAGAPERIQNPRPEFTEILRMNRLLNRRGMKLQAMPMSRIWVDTRPPFPITVNSFIYFEKLSEKSNFWNSTIFLVKMFWLICICEIKTNIAIMTLGT